MPAFLLLAILAPRLSHLVKRAAWNLVITLDRARDAIEPIACDLSHADADAAAWRRDLGLDGEV